jgi:hypothetical protein
MTKVTTTLDRMFFSFGLLVFYLRVHVSNMVLQPLLYMARGI